MTLAELEAALALESGECDGPCCDGRFDSGCLIHDPRYSGGTR